MRIRLPLVMGFLALAVTLPVTSADAGSARLGTLSITCDGTLRHESFLATGFPASSDQFILGSEVTVVDTKSKLRYLLVRAAGNENQQIIGLGPKVNRAGFALPTFFKVTANASGDILITVDAVCAKGPAITTFVNILFN